MVPSFYKRDSAATETDMIASVFCGFGMVRETYPTATFTGRPAFSNPVLKHSIRRSHCVRLKKALDERSVFVYDNASCKVEKNETSMSGSLSERSAQAREMKRQRTVICLASKQRHDSFSVVFDVFSRTRERRR